MSVRNLEYLFRPRSVAVVGASNRADSVGRAVMRNLLGGGFPGTVMPVNPGHKSVTGVLAYPDVRHLPERADLAVVCTPPRTVPRIIADLGEHGTRAAVVLSAGLRQVVMDDGRNVEEAMLDAARPHLLRILGGNCLGVLVPGLDLNASFSHIPALPGRVALIHQSGALCTALLDWATSNGIGFSHFVSIGDSADIDFGDVLDYLASEPSAHSILMYVEAVTGARKFMSAARAAARNKPVILVKAARVREGAPATASHTGAMMSSDDVYDTAIRRAGMLRVFSTREMFDAVETLGIGPRITGERLAIVTNGVGPGVIATDALIFGGGALAQLGADTVKRLDDVLPPLWSRRNPVDLAGDADGERYAKALEILMDDEKVGTVLVLHAPTAVVSSDEAVRGVIRAGGGKRRNRIIASWLGGDTVANARRMLTEAGIPNYDTPDEAVRAFLHIVRYQRNQALLMETPVSIPEDFAPDTDKARSIIERALADGRDMLTETEAKEVLAAYGVPVVETRVASSPEQASEVAASIGFPVALKVLSDRISRKSEVGGVVLDLDGERDVLHAARNMSARVRRLRPEVQDAAFSVQPMARRPGAFELIVGAAADPVFGPVILFGEGGTAVELIDDKAVALPPLNMKLAMELVGSTRVARRLGGHAGRRGADLEKIGGVLIRISQLVADLPEVAELDINPLLADADGVLALDARIRVVATDQAGPDRLAIRPYPKQLEEHTRIGDMDLLLRPIRPEDEPTHKAFVDSLEPQDVRFRFFGMVRYFAHDQLARFTQIDYDREMAFIAVDTATRETLGVVRAVSDPDNVTAEFAIIVGSHLKGKGLGHALLSKMIAYCRSRGTRYLVGEVLAENDRMIALARKLGFAISPESTGKVKKMNLRL
ncbi:MAG: bifunctional acetate--CoA ligase family protein/GNAT family N-acetyltransferase [Arenicellales bacterium]